MFKIEYSKNFNSKYFSKVPKEIQERIKRYIDTDLKESPFSAGKQLKGRLRGRWSFRIGDYRIIYKIDNKLVVVLIIKIGHRKDIYDQLPSPKGEGLTMSVDWSSAHID